MSFHGLSLTQAIDILPHLHNYFLDQNIDIETEILYEYLQNSQEWWSENRYYLGNTSVYIYDPISDKVLQNEEKRFMSPFIFHDVDYFPVGDVSYDTDTDTPFYPVGKVLFLNQDNQPRNIEDIPAGYRNFHITVGDHSGGVFVLSKELFFKTNGLNPFFKGWGKEDDATRDRLRFLGYDWKRNNKALFYALYHEDSKPEDDDLDFINNNKLYTKLTSDIEVGISNVTAEVVEYDMPGHANLRWLKIKNFEYTN